LTVSVTFCVIVNNLQVSMSVTELNKPVYVYKIKMAEPEAALWFNNGIFCF